MARNIEIKASVPDRVELEQHTQQLSSDKPQLIQQDDTFFRCDTGRLKLRTLSASHGELIYYQRSNELEPTESFYILSVTTEPHNLRKALSLAYGVMGRVQKERTLYLVGRTRVHLDRVLGLGDFVELEVVLAEDEPMENGVLEANELMSKLGISEKNLVKDAYVDLLNA